MTTTATTNNNEKDETKESTTTYDTPKISFEYDLEWLAITRAFSAYPVFESNGPVNIPSISQMKR